MYYNVHNMKARLEDKKLAIELRKKGFSYREIQEKVPVSKGLLSGWLNNLTLTEQEEMVLKDKVKNLQDTGRIKSMLSNRNRRKEREKVASDSAIQIFEKNVSSPLFLIGVTLYWAEGSKRDSSFQFINSDPEMIVFMYKWIKKYLQVIDDKITFRLFIHKIPGYEGCEEKWAKKLGIEPYLFKKTIYKPTRHAIKKNPDYQGCLRITVSGIYYLRLMKAWQKLLIQYYVDTRPWLKG